MFSLLTVSLAVVCVLAFAAAFYFWRSSYSADVMSKFLPTVCGFFSILGGPLLAMFTYVVILPHAGTWAILGLVFYAVIAFSASIFGFMTARPDGSTKGE